mgnify:CR=1 FL=1
MNELRIYVACLSSYSAGRLYGSWIDATQDAEDIEAEVQAMLKKSPMGGAEEWAIHDHEGFGDTIGEHTSFTDVAAIAAFFEEHGEAGKLALSNHCGNIDDAENTMEHYNGVHESLEAWAEDFIEETGMLSEVPDELQRYFDVKSWADDQCMTTERGTEGLHVWSQC